MVLAYSHDMVAGSDGTVTGGRGQHRPVVITKNIDKSSPLISNALQDGEEIKCAIDFYRTSSTGSQEKYYTAVSYTHLDVYKRQGGTRKRPSHIQTDTYTVASTGTGRTYPASASN